MFFQIHTTTGCNQRITFTDPTSGQFWSLHRKFYSLKDGWSQIKDPTNGSSTPTKANTMLQSVHVLPNTYFYRMEPKNYVYRPNIRLVLVIKSPPIFRYLTRFLWARTKRDLGSSIFGLMEELQLILFAKMISPLQHVVLLE